MRWRDRVPNLLSADIIAYLRYCAGMRPELEQFKSMGTKVCKKMKKFSKQMVDDTRQVHPRMELPNYFRG